ncbi:MAG: single-stranded DNA-binding protein [Candidatus Moeniiplasma glomeromycotorum]|nr:single-stranded DNA-binding protein [Candidatus Moeniiplasma glomeromycotorum]
MLNKIRIIGRIILKEENEKNISELVDSAVTESDVNEFQSERRESWFYFSVLVPVPSGSLTTLRCIARGEIAHQIKKELKENEIIEVKGYLRNDERGRAREFEQERKKEGRQIIIRVVEFNKIDLIFDELVEQVKEKKINSNQVRLLGKIITDLQDPENYRNSELLSFKLAVSRESVKSPLFFCRTQGELISEIKEKLKKNDVVLLEGFLQTKKIEEWDEMESRKRFIRISSIICQGFTLLDNDSANIFHPLDNLVRVFKEVKKIDFNKPKE